MTARSNSAARADAPRRVAIIQSAYIPWKGFYDLIASVDAYVILDDVQYVRRHWHNRNRIMTAQGPQWLTIPVATKDHYHQSILETEIAGDWADKHWRSLEQNYRKAPHFERIGTHLRKLYESAKSKQKLSDINALFLRYVLEELQIDTRVYWSHEVSKKGRKSQRLLEICQALGASTYVTGPSARAYLDTGLFEDRGIAVEWFRYGPYPPYPQLHGRPQVDEVSILDVLFNTGHDARQYIHHDDSRPGQAPVI